MDANIGDEIVVDGVNLRESKREGEILELDTLEDVVHCRVRWDDGRESICRAGSTTHVVKLAPKS